MAETSRTRVGLGTDLHRLADGRTLVIGGIEIPSAKGPVGHSDGDVALHALTDALLGAAAAGDIGEMVPDTDAAHRGLDSCVIVERAMERIRKLGFGVVNADLVVELEEPKLAPHRDRIRARIAALLGIPVDRVGFKAKTAEGLGPVGQGEAIAAQAVVQLEAG